VAIPTEVRAEAEAVLSEWCSQHSSADVADRMRYSYEIEANSAFLIEQRPSFMNPNDWTSRPVAKFRFSPAKKVWSLYWSDRGGDRWNRLSGKSTAPDIRTLLQTVVTDPSGVFWG
jgi:hypothetical protein